jgi:hypothetical protein
LTLHGLTYSRNLKSRIISWDITVVLPRRVSRVWQGGAGGGRWGFSRQLDTRGLSCPLKGHLLHRPVTGRHESMVIFAINENTFLIEICQFHWEFA